MKTSWLHWLRRTVRQSWRYLIQKVRLPRALLRSEGKKAHEGHLTSNVCYRLHSPKLDPEDDPNLKDPALAKEIETRSRNFHEGKIFVPLVAAAEKGAVITALIEEKGLTDKQHLVTIYQNQK